MTVKPIVITYNFSAASAIISPYIEDSEIPFNEIN